MLSVISRAAGVACAAASVLLATPPAGAEDLAYVTNYRSGTLTILGPDAESPPASLPLAATGAPVQQVPGENPEGAVAGLAIGGPVAVALSPDGGLAYVVQTGAPGTLLVVDTVKRRVAATIPLETEPFALGVSHGGDEVYVANFGSDTVSVVDTGTRRVAATIPVGPGPSGVALSPERAYVANTGSNTVSVIDLSSRKVVGEIVVDQGPFGVALARESLLVANSGTDSVSVVNTANDLLVSTIAVGRVPVAVALSPDAKQAFVSNQGGDSVSIVDTAANRVTATVRVGHRPFGLALTGDGAKLLVANTGANTVSVVDTDRREVLRSAAVGTAPFGVAIGTSPNGSACHCAVGARRSGPAWATVVLAGLLLPWRRFRRAQCALRFRRRGFGTRAQRALRLSAGSGQSV